MYFTKGGRHCRCFLHPYRLLQVIPKLLHFAPKVPIFAKRKTLQIMICSVLLILTFGSSGATRILEP